MMVVCCDMLHGVRMVGGRLCARNRKECGTRKGRGCDRSSCWIHLVLRWVNSSPTRLSLAAQKNVSAGEAVPCVGRSRTLRIQRVGNMQKQKALDSSGAFVRVRRSAGAPHDGHVMPAMTQENSGCRGATCCPGNDGGSYPAACAGTSRWRFITILFSAPR